MKTLTYKHWFWITLVGTLLLKCYFAQLVPMTGDEVEYVAWGQHFAWGYYDHPPMIAWLLHPISALGLNPIWLRSLQLITPGLIGLGMLHILKKHDEPKAYLMSLLFLISPVSLFNICILTDTPLAFFSFFCMFFLYLADRYDRIGYYALSGLCLGAAFLSKYLMFPLLITLFFYFFFSRGIKHKFWKYVLLLACSLPFVIQNIVWNYNNAWVNIMFNLITRNEGESASFRTVGLYLLCVIYLYTPILVYYGIKYGKGLLTGCYRSPLKLFATAMFAALIFYGILSIDKEIGLHWLFSAYPFAFLAFFIVIDRNQIKKCIKFMLCYCGLQIVVVLIAFHMPISWMSNTQKQYDRINWFLNFEDILPTLKPYMKDFHMATPGFSQAYLIAYRTKGTVSVWDTGSYHGREDDITTNYKDLNGKNIAILFMNDRHEPVKSEYEPYFERTELKKFYLKKSEYYVVLGYGFNYPLYRENILRRIYEDFYQIPGWLPHKTNFFKEKYDF